MGTSVLANPITEEGVYDLPHEVYLDDPVCEPSLNNSIAKVLTTLSPAHAYAMHPRLGAAMEIDDDPEAGTDASDIGDVAHQMFLKGESAVRVLNVPDFRTDKAKQARAAAIAEGVIPIKMELYGRVQGIVVALERFRDRTGAFTAGKPEQTLVWREGAEWGRCKVDWLPDEPSAYLWDLKTTGGRATLRKWSRVCFEMSYDMQAVYYCRGAECVRGEPPMGMKFCVVEQKPPYGIRVFELSPMGVEVGEAQVHHAIATWADCRKTNEWPSYADDTEWLDPPVPKLREWEHMSRTGRFTAAPPTQRSIETTRSMIEEGDIVP